MRAWPIDGNKFIGRCREMQVVTFTVDRFMDAIELMRGEEPELELGDVHAVSHPDTHSKFSSESRELFKSCWQDRNIAKGQVFLWSGLIFQGVEDAVIRLVLRDDPLEASQDSMDDATIPWAAWQARDPGPLGDLSEIYDAAVDSGGRLAKMGAVLR